MPELKLGGHGGKLLNVGGLVRVPDIKTAQRSSSEANATALLAAALCLPYAGSLLYSVLESLAAPRTTDIRAA